MKAGKILYIVLAIVAVISITWIIIAHIRHKDNPEVILPLPEKRHEKSIFNYSTDGLFYNGTTRVDFCVLAYLNVSEQTYYYTSLMPAIQNNQDIPGYYRTYNIQDDREDTYFLDSLIGLTICPKEFEYD